VQGSPSPKWPFVVVGVSLVLALLGCGLLFATPALVKRYLVEPFAIPGESMVPTILPRDRVLVDKRAYLSAAPRVGDVVVFADPSGNYPALIKRVAALGGQTVDIRDGDLYVDGRRQTLPGVRYGQTQPGPFPLPATIPDGYVWLMGDNRSNSADSRFIGPQPVSALKGRAVYIYFPPSRARLIR
jgi:signal peptidase I